MAGSSMVDHADVRARVHGMWAAAAPGWAEHADAIEARTSAVGERLLDLAAPAPGEDVLELACGAGGLGLAAARRAPGAAVVLSDVAPSMVAIAAARARGVACTTTRVLDLEDIDVPDGSFDVVVCREGLMFATDHARAAAEAHRVLRPGGRLAVSVWGPRDRNPWLALALDGLATVAGAPVPPPGVPGPFALDDAGRLASLLRRAGLAGVSVTEVAVPLRADSFVEWWTRTSTVAGPLARRVAALAPDRSAALEAWLRRAVAPYATDEGIELPGVALVASGRRP